MSGQGDIIASSSSTTKKRSLDDCSPVSGIINKRSNSSTRSDYEDACDATIIESVIELDLDLDLVFEERLIKQGEPSSMAATVDDMKKLIFGDEYRSFLNRVIAESVAEAVRNIASDLEATKQTVSDLKKENVELKLKFDAVEEKLDRIEQHEKANTVIIQNNWPENKDENLVDRVVELARCMNVKLQSNEIQFAFRVGKKKTHLTSTPLSGGSMGNKNSRPVMVKFTSIAIKNAMRMARTNLKKVEALRDIYINEDLTAARRSLLNSCVLKKQNKMIQGCWTENGKVMIKTNEGLIRRA